MKLKYLIMTLQKFDPELTVCLSDWSQQHTFEYHNEKQAEILEVVDTNYLSSYDGKLEKGKILSIGGF